MKLGRKLWMALCLALAVCLCAQVALPVTTGVVTTAQAAAKVKLNKTKATIYESQTLKLELTGATGKVTWSSSDKSIAKVDRKGKVTAKKAGKATITAKYAKKEYRCVVTVKEPLFVNKKEIKIKTGEIKTIKLTCKLDDDEINGSTSNKKKADWNWDGDFKNGVIKIKVFGIAAGTATLSFKDKKSKKTVKVKVTVTGSPVPIKVNVGKDLTLTQGENRTIIVTGNPVMDWVYQSSDPEVVTAEWGDDISDNKSFLTLIPLSPGNASIVIRDKRTNEMVELQIKVIANEDYDDDYDDDDDDDDADYITEIGKLYGMTISEANSRIMDTLTYYEENFYTCGYFGVMVNSSGKIKSFVLTDGGSRYTLMYIYPGMSASSAMAKLESLGFVYRTSSDNTITYSNSALPNMFLSVKYVSDKVDYIAFG